ncbi:MAG: hypothetical protein MUF72_22230 [Elainella sp. Prado103]|nr:hypothetical protein [Elainella sp. Prado103]
MSQATSAEIRATLVDALQIDLVGPKPDDTEHAEEILTQAPSKWYLTGFLAPFGSKPDDRSDDEADVEPQELGDGATSEDSQSPFLPGVTQGKSTLELSYDSRRPSATATEH